MKDPKKTSRRSKALEQASDVVEQTRMFFKSQSLLKIPFGLRWEAYPPLFKVRQPSPHSFIMSEEANISTVSAKIDMYDDKKGKNALWPNLATLDGCTDFLRSSCLNFQALEQATLMVYHFKGSYQMGDADLPDEVNNLPLVLFSLQIQVLRGSMTWCLCTNLPQNIMPKVPEPGFNRALARENAFARLGE